LNVKLVVHDVTSGLQKVKGSNMKKALRKEVPNFLRRGNTVYGTVCRNRKNLGKM
jgi:hypothetical protein